MKRRAFFGFLGGAATFYVAAPANARGMYCTRHRAECAENDKRKAEQAAAEEARRAKLTPEERAAEDKARDEEWVAQKAEWARQDKEAAERQAAEWAQTKAFVWKTFGAVAVSASLIGGSLMWILKQRK